MSDVFPLKISIWETSVNMLNADFSVFICKFFRFLSSLHFSLVNKPQTPDIARSAGTVTGYPQE